MSLLGTAGGISPRVGSTPLGTDGASLLSFYLLLLVAIPSQFVVAALGGAGAPSLLVGVCCLLWWIFAKVYADRGEVGEPQPIRRAAAMFAVAIALSYVAACIRPINAAELSTATLGLINAAGWLGVLLLAHDGIASSGRLHTYLDRLTLAGAAMAAFGLIQFITHQVWIDHIAIPGLSTNSALYGAQYREGFTRPSGTAIHPIEFGAVLAMLLPISLARLATQPTRSWLVRGFPPAAILVAISLSSSRSALVTAGVGVLVMIPALNRDLRRVALLGFGAIGAAVFVLVPGMLGTILGLFTGVGEDASSRSRLDSYSIAVEYISQGSPFGRGLATFLPHYRIFDNEYLLLLVEIGICGVGALLVLLITVLLPGPGRDGRLVLPAERVTTQGLVAAVAAGATGLALFDGFSFPMVPGLLFLLIGLVGAARRLAGQGLATVVPPAMVTIR